MSVIPALRRRLKHENYELEAWSGLYREVQTKTYQTNKKINKQISKQKNKINQNKTQRIKRWFKIKYSVSGMNSNSFQF